MAGNKTDLEETKKEARLVQWNVGILSNSLQEMMAKRAATNSGSCLAEEELRRMELDVLSQSGVVLDEVQEIIRFSIHHDCSPTEKETLGSCKGTTA